MCGIAGLVVPPGRAADRAVVERMCQVILHRGPDEDGFLFDANVGLGMRRLSIIDLSTGKQPLHNETQTVWAMLNGEIYNYRELRADLEKRGHRFYTHSDTETIVHLYEEYGERLRRASERHVRHRRLGRAAQAPGTGARPHRRKAALPVLEERHAGLRFGNQVPAGNPGWCRAT